MNSDKTSHTQNSFMQNTCMLKTDMRKSDTFLKIWGHEVCHFQAYNCTNNWYMGKFVTSINFASAFLHYQSYIINHYIIRPGISIRILLRLSNTNCKKRIV